MGCLFPSAGFRTGYPSKNGKDDYIILPHGFGDMLEVSLARKYKPIGPAAPLRSMNGHTYIVDPVPVPCGHCVGCRLERARQWKVRICLEAKNFLPEDVHFITLTYDDEHLPFNLEGQPVLVKGHLQQFMRNLRNHVGKFRFFASAEYGTLTKRPHYHLILFGHIPDLVPSGVNQFNSECVSLAWPHGLTDIKMAEPGSIAYTCGYVEKKQLDPDYFGYDVKPFLLMSDKPGLGFSELSKIDLTRDHHVYGDFGNGCHSSSIPDALNRKLEGSLGFDDYKANRKIFGIANADTLHAVYHSISDGFVSDIREHFLLDSLQANRKDSL